MMSLNSLQVTILSYKGDDYRLVFDWTYYYKYDIMEAVKQLIILKGYLCKL